MIYDFFGFLWFYNFVGVLCDMCVTKVVIRSADTQETTNFITANMISN